MIMTTFDKARTDNSTYKKLAFQWLNEALCFVSSAVLADSFVLRNRQLLVAANRCHRLKERTVTAIKIVINYIKPRVMKPKFNFFLILSTALLFNAIFPWCSFAQKPPHLDSLIFLPENRPIEYQREDGLTVINDNNPGHWPDYGFESNPALPSHKTKEDIWHNAPIIVEGRTQSGTIKQDVDVYPSIVVSNKEVYDVLPYALSYVYRGDVKGDTIYILLPRYNYNKVQPPYPGHSCKAFVFVPKGYSIAFLKPVTIKGFTYFTPCNTDYEGFEWVNSVSKFSENGCDSEFYTKQDIAKILSQKGIQLDITRSISKEKEKFEKKKEDKNLTKKSDAIPVTGQKIEEYIRDKGWLRTIRQNIKLRGNDDFIYSIGDMEFYVSGMDQYDLEFKVYGTAEQNRNFGAALLFLEYNSDVFGDSIMAHA